MGPPHTIPSSTRLKVTDVGALQVSVELLNPPKSKKEEKHDAEVNRILNDFYDPSLVDEPAILANIMSNNPNHAYPNHCLKASDLSENDLSFLVGKII